MAVEAGRPLYLPGARGGAVRYVYGALAGVGGAAMDVPPDRETPVSADEEFERFYNSRCPPVDRTDGDSPTDVFRQHPRVARPSGSLRFSRGSSRPGDIAAGAA